MPKRSLPTPSEEVPHFRSAVSIDTKLRSRRGKQHHHGDDVCWIVVVGLKGLFSVLLLP